MAGQSIWLISYELWALGVAGKREIVTTAKPAHANQELQAMKKTAGYLALVLHFFGLDLAVFFLLLRSLVVKLTLQKCAISFKL